MFVFVIALPSSFAQLANWIPQSDRDRSRLHEGESPGPLIPQRMEYFRSLAQIILFSPPSNHFYILLIAIKDTPLTHLSSHIVPCPLSHQAAAPIITIARLPPLDFRRLAHPRLDFQPRALHLTVA